MKGHIHRIESSENRLGTTTTLRSDRTRQDSDRTCGRFAAQRQDPTGPTGVFNLSRAREKNTEMNKTFFSRE